MNDTPCGHVRAWTVGADGTLPGGAVLCDVTGEGEGVIDGTKIAVCGELLVNGPGGVHMFDAAARCLGMIRTAGKSTNFCLGGAGLRTLFVMASISACRVETRMTGPPMIHPRAAG